MKVFPAVEVIDGAGVRIRRYIGAFPREIDPFLLLDEIKSSNPEDYRAGFPPHPHRGFQTITYMVKGRFRHKDSSGGEGVLEEGWVQWMNAGRGVVHSEMPLTDKGLLWGFQLWINNPASQKMSEPFYHSYPARRKTISEGVVLSDLVGDVMKEKGFYPLIYLHIQMDEGKTFKIDLPEENTTFVAVSEGIIELNGEEIRKGHLVVPECGKITIRSVSRSHLLLGSARPLREPIVRWGPFVMNSEEEIKRAVEDFRMGRFT